MIMYTLVLKRFCSHGNLSHIRNVGLIAHIDAGKTTTTERILFYAGKTNFLGDVDKGDTVTDYLDQERERGISIMSAAATLKWQGHEVNLIDTPGHVDFTVEVERALCVLDGAICILDATKGVQAQTLNVWRQAVHHAVPRLLYANKMDRIHSREAASLALDKCVEDVAARLVGTTKAVPVHLPVYERETFVGLVDLPTLSLKVWDLRKDPHGKLVHASALTSQHEVYEEALHRRGQLLETVAQFHEPLAEEYVSMTQPELLLPPKSLLEALRKATISGEVVPMLCGSSRRNVGVQALLDGALAYLPHPGERPALLQFLQRHPANQLCALVFKVVHDERRGALTFLRLYAGKLQVGDMVNRMPSVGGESKSLKVQKILRLVGDHYEECSSAGPGSIVAVPGWSATFTGDVLLTGSMEQYFTLWKADKQHEEFEDVGKMSRNMSGQPAAPVPVESNLLQRTLTGGHSLRQFQPVVFASVEAPSLSAMKTMEHALQCLQREDPSIRVFTSEETGQTVISGMGDLHLEVSVERIRRQYRVDLKLGTMRIHYCEHPALSDQPKVYSRVVHSIDGKRKIPILVEVSLRSLSQVDSENDLQFKNWGSFSWTNIPPQLMRSLREGLRAGLRSGPLLRCPVLGCQVTVQRLALVSVSEDGTVTPVDSEGAPFPKFGMAQMHAMSHAVQAAAREIVKTALLEEKANMRLLEPFMRLNIHINKENRVALKDILGDLSRRRSHVLGVEEQVEPSGQRTGTSTHVDINALAPLSEMFGYSTFLRKTASGQADLHMAFAQYELMDPLEQEKVLLASRYAF